MTKASGFDSVVLHSHTVLLYTQLNIHIKHAMAIGYRNQPSMAQGHENGSTLSQSNPECNNLFSQNLIEIQGSHQSICVGGPDVDVPFYSPDSRKIHRSRHYVNWGIAWHPL